MAPGHVPEADPEALVSLACRQDGLVTRTQALAAGLTRRAISHRLTSGRWTALLPGVYLTEGDATPRAWARAASLRWGRDVVVSHEAAASVFDLPVVATPA
nr:type IV toxin-antitoxin system AbiEi family antitoxin domain-containing protein [Micromonospora sp. DSM 115978]